MEQGNSNAKEYKIEKIESYKEEIAEIDKNIVLNENKIKNLKVANIVTIILGISSLMIKFPKVFNQEFFLNYVCLVLTVISSFSISIKKEVLKSLSYCLNSIRDVKIFSIESMEELLENNEDKQLIK